MREGIRKYALFYLEIQQKCTIFVRFRKYVSKKSCCLKPSLFFSFRKTLFFNHTSQTLMKNRSLISIQALLVLVLLCIGTSASWAIRVDKMVAKPITDKFIEIVGSGGALLPNGSIGYQSYYTNADYNTYVALPFAFNYDDINYSAGNTMYAHMGSLSFNYWSSTSNYCYYYSIMTGQGYPATYFPNAIAVFSGLQAGNSSYTSGVYSMTQGSAPNRKFIVEWYQITNYYAGELGNCSYEVILNEGANSIDLRYEKNNFSMTNSSYSSYTKCVGLNGSTSPSWAQLSITSSTLSTPSTNYRIGPPGPNIQLSSYPKLVNFGSVVTGASANNSATVQNVGTLIYGPPMLSVKSVSITGDPDFSIVSVPAPSDSISINDTRSIVVKFSPTIDGIRTAALTIVTNGADSGVQTLSLQGVGLAPLISVDTNVLFKNKQVRLGQSMVARVIINSTNLPTLNITGFQFVGADAGEFSVAQYPSSMAIPGNKSDSVFIRYTPTKEGRHIATMNILNNSINNPVLPITLWGTGILPHIVVTPRMLQFDSVALGDQICKEITINNPGTDTLLILKNIMNSNDGDFTYAGLVGTDTIIPPDKSKTLNICFKPKQMGSRAARVILTTNIPKTFESVPRDTASAFSITINGTGVPYGTLSQSINGAEGAGFVDSTIIGTTVCMWDTIRNNGDADLTISSVGITGANAADYTLSGIKTPFIIKAHSSVVAQICGTPSAAGLRNASLAITGTSNGKSLTSTSALNVFGWTVCATADPSPLFKDKLVLDGTIDTATVTITNCGDVPTSYTASLPNGTVYSLISPATSAVIAPKATTNFMVTFAPTTMGALPANLTVTPSTPELAAITVPMSGVGACAVVTAAAPTIPQTGSDGHASFTVTIDNTPGNYAWTAGTPLVTPNDGVFAVVGTVADASANGTTTVNMTFNPKQISTNYSAQLTFPNAAPACAAALTVNLSQSSTTESVDTRSEADGFKLGQNHPNPFTVNSVFTFTTPTEAAVRLSVSDLTGKVVKIISDGRVSAGEHNVTLEANDFSSGTYVLTLQSGTTTLAKTFVVTK